MNQWINEPSSLVKVVLEHQLNYPSGSSFCLKGYQGIVDYKKIKNHIIDKASSTDGTLLTIGICDNLSHKKT